MINRRKIFSVLAGIGASLTGAKAAPLFDTSDFTFQALGKPVTLNGGMTVVWVDELSSDLQRQHGWKQIGWNFKCDEGGICEETYDYISRDGRDRYSVTRRRDRSGGTDSGIV